MIFTLGTDNMFVTFDLNTFVGYNSYLKVLVNDIFILTEHRARFNSVESTSIVGLIV